MTPISARPSRGKERASKQYQHLRDGMHGGLSQHGGNVQKAIIGAAMALDIALLVAGAIKLAEA